MIGIEHRPGQHRRNRHRDPEKGSGGSSRRSVGRECGGKAGESMTLVWHSSHTWYNPIGLLTTRSKQSVIPEPEAEQFDEQPALSMDDLPRSLPALLLVLEWSWHGSLQDTYCISCFRSCFCVCHPGPPRPERFSSTISVPVSPIGYILLTQLPLTTSRPMFLRALHLKYTLCYNLAQQCK